MNKKDTSIIFCQSAIKVSAVLVCYEYEKSIGHNVIIVVRNVRNIYEFIISLKLDAKIFWFDNYPCDIFHVVRKRAMENFIAHQMEVLMVSSSSLSSIYFTSLCHDLPMCCYLSRMPKDRIVKLQGHLDICNGIDDYVLPDINYSIKWKLKRFIYSCLLNYRLRLQTVVNPALAIDIGYYRYPFFDGSDMSVCDRYLYAPKERLGKKALIFASEYVDVFKDREDYINVFVSCIKKLKELGYSVYIKGHPRIGTLSAAKELADEEIPTFVPAEFLNYSFFDCAFGLTSTAICSSSAKVASYSLLPLTKLVTDEHYQEWCDYLDKTSNGLVRYLNSFDEIY